MGSRADALAAGYVPKKIPTSAANPKPMATDDITAFVGLERPSDSARLLGPAIVVPLLADKKLIGIINLVNSKGGRKFNSDAERLISLIATLAAQYVQRAKLHEALFRDTVRLKDHILKSMAWRSNVTHAFPYSSRCNSTKLLVMVLSLNKIWRK